MSKELIEFSSEQKKIIMAQYFPVGTTNEEMAYCMSIAKSLGLNPILKEIYFVPRKSKSASGQWVEKIEPLIGRDAFLKLAHNSGAFAGMETSSKIEKVPTLRSGVWVEEEDLVATCKVYRKDTERPVIAKVAFREYAQKTRDGTLTKFWKEKPQTMLQKVSESQALRKAFNVSGVYTEEEINDVVTKETTVTAEATDDGINDLLTNDLQGKNVDIVTGEVLDQIPEAQIEEVLEKEAEAQTRPYKLEIE